ncbi:MAG: hypothetical protein RL754_271 [Bacteroidota bacterium]|jgi:hypothetical protein
MKANFFVITAFVFSVAAFGQHQGANLHSSRHFYAPTGRTVPTDSIYMNWAGPLLDVNFGINNKLTAGIGTPLFTGVYGTLSYGGELFNNEKINGRIGTLTGFPAVGGGLYTLPYGVATFGSPENEFTLGAGYFYMNPALQENLFGRNNDKLNPNSAVVNLGGYHQLNMRLGFTYEFWYLPESDWTIVMPGVRFYTNRYQRYWNVGIIRLSIPYLDDDLSYFDSNGNYIEVLTRRIQNITLPMLSFATYL